MLSRKQFGEALRRGQGRALAHVRQHGDADVEDLLLDACTRNLAYDSQAEGHRGAWLMEMLALLPEISGYRSAILETFDKSTIHNDVEQMASIVRRLAEDGDQQAHRALYAKFDRQEFDEWVIAPHLVALDGVAGMLHVARGFGRRLAEDSGFWADSRFWLDEQLGSKTVTEALDGAASSDEDIRRFVDTVGKVPGTPEPRPTLDLEAFLAAVATARHPRIVASQFAKSATAADLETLLDLAERESDASRVAAMLAVFRRVDASGGATRLLPFARSSDQAVREVAIDALARFSDPAITVLSHALLASGELHGIGLLARNFTLNDFGRAMELLTSVDDPDRFHDLGMDMLKVADGRPEAMAGLLWVYETTPCSFCRMSAVNELVEVDLLPGAVATECRDDCHQETRELVAKHVAPARS